MITYVVGDLFTSPAKVLVNTVNTVGVMGKGIAYDFKQFYPEMFERYRYFCEQGMLNVGQLWLYKTPRKWILNFPTKKHWHGESKIEYIEAGLQKFASTYDSKGMLSVSFPMLGCGNGELDWEKEVQPLMEEYLQPLPINVYIHVMSRKGAISLLYGRTSTIKQESGSNVSPKRSNFVPTHRRTSTIRRKSRSNVSPKRSNFVPAHRKTSTIRQESQSNRISYKPKALFNSTEKATYSAIKATYSATYLTEEETYLTKEEKTEFHQKLKKLEGQYDALAQNLKDRNTDLHHRFDMGEQLNLVAGQIQHIQGILNRATIVEDTGPSDKVRIGSTVVIREDGTNEDEEYKIGGFATTSEGKISSKSPIGSALLGKKKGQEVRVQTPGGPVKFKIVDVR